MAQYMAILSVANNDTDKVITHNLNNSGAVLTCVTPGGWPGRPFKTAQAANTITVTYGNQAPPTGTLTLDVEVKTP